MIRTAPPMALLIDAENVSSRACPEILRHARRWGEPILRRAYGDWSQPSLGGWRECVMAHGLQAAQCFSYAKGKGAADAALIVEAMDLLHEGRFGAFCLVSSDSDFARLAMRIREQGASVYGIAEAKAPPAFRAIFTECAILDQPSPAPPICAEPRPPSLVVALVRPSASGTPLLAAPRPSAPAATPDQPPAAVRLSFVSPSPQPPASVATPVQPQAPAALSPEILKRLRAAFQETRQKDGWACLSAMGMALRAGDPVIEAKAFGHATLSKLLKASGLFELDLITGPGRQRARLK